MMGSGPTFAIGLADHRDRVAIVTEQGERLSYAALADRADAFAAQLGEEPGLLFIECRNQVEPLAAYLGALRAGYPVLLLPARSPSSLLETYRPDFIYAPDGDGYRLRPGPGSDLAPHPDLALLLSTSGTTGSSKLVRLSGAAVHANAQSIASYLAIGADERAITSLPFHYSYGLSVVNSHLLSGASLALTEASVIDPEFWALVDREQVSSLAGVPYTYELLERQAFRSGRHPSLRTLTQAGGRLPRDLVTAYGAWAAAEGARRFFVMYGQTEATARMAYLPPAEVLARPDAIGIAIPDGQFSLVGDDGRQVTGAGRQGELVYAGPNIMMGYAQSREDLGLGAELAELKTGDIAVRDAAGFYRIVGRKSRFAKVFGLRIGLDEVEALLRGQGLTAAAASDDKVIAAMVVGGEPTAVAETLAAALKLPPSAFEVVVVDDLPLLPSGKVDYRRVLLAAQQSRAAAPPGHDDEGLTKTFARVFRKPAGPTDSFVSLGGDSLNYVVLSLEVEDAIGYLPAGWELMPLAELEAMVPAIAVIATGFWRAIDVEIVVRAVAIISVVTLHVSRLPLAGGAHVLLMLAGYNLARYQRSRLAEGRALNVVATFARRIILPYYLLLLAYLMMKHWLNIPSLLLVSNFVGRRGILVEPFWFLEALLQCMLIIAVIAAPNPVRRVIQNRPWSFGLGLLLFGVALKVITAAMFERAHLLDRSADAVFFLFALGWCVQQASTLRRRIVVTALAVALAAMELVQVPGFSALQAPANISHSTWLLLAALSITWAPRVSIPRLLHPGVTLIAAASFYIYLSHVIPVDLIYWNLGVKSLLLNLVVSLGIGIGVWWLFQNADGVVHKWRLARGSRIDPA